jgi:hypothetical protein
MCTAWEKLGATQWLVNVPARHTFIPAASMGDHLQTLVVAIVLDYLDHLLGLC